MSAGDNLLGFSLNEIKRLQRTGVIEIDDNNKVLSFEEKLQEPKSNHAV